MLSLDDTEAIKELHFSHHEAAPFARLNHGSFGAAPLEVIREQERYRALWFKQPDYFVHGEASAKEAAEGGVSDMHGFLEAKLTEARDAAAELLNSASPEEVCLLDNTTTAAATVALDLVWGFVEGIHQRGDSVLLLDCAYGAIRKCFEHYTCRAGAQVLTLPVPFPVSSADEIVDSLRQVLEEFGGRRDGRKICLAVLDHVTSLPSVVLPIRRLVALCHAHGVPVFVDGAHAVGNVEVDVQAIDAEYYVTNLHKWAFCPPAVAAFHAKPHVLARLHHPVPSHNLGQGLFREAQWIGTRDYSPMLCIPSACTFVQDVCGGWQSLRISNRSKAAAMAELLAAAWGTHLGASGDLASSMCMVALPDATLVRSEQDALDLRTRLRDDFQVEVPIWYNKEATVQEDSEGAHASTHGKGSMPSQKHVYFAYARISHQIYNSEPDYRKLQHAILSIIDA
eukprot:jgi/Mesen1/8046/ME000043S07427